MTLVSMAKATKRETSAASGMGICTGFAARIGDAGWVVVRRPCGFAGHGGGHGGFGFGHCEGCVVMVLVVKGWMSSTGWIGYVRIGCLAGLVFLFYGLQIG
ncbi:hypothetical protein M0R45_007416 [Rubus argutus]|uniref:NADH dehydrogenase subunit 6 n=1 Tax=Rubus argutus TaxID=59490 RepID=A0AAW1XY76_RUBAR